MYYTLVHPYHPSAHRFESHGNKMIRKGISGDWRNHFTKEQSDRFDDVYAKEMTGTPAEHWWKEEMKWIDQ